MLLSFTGGFYKSILWLSFVVLEIAIAIIFFLRSKMTNADKGKKAVYKVGKEKMSEVSSFVYNVESEGEVDIGVGEAEDWTLHKVGSYADISIDHNDFFGTGDQDSLKITFEKENTGEGPITSVGWLDVQKAVEPLHML